MDFADAASRPDAADRVRPGERILMRAIALLHEQGFETVRVLPYAAPSGMAFRFQIRALEDAPAPGEEFGWTQLYDEPGDVVHYSTSGCAQLGEGLFDGLHRGLVTAEHLAWALLERLPAAGRRPGTDPAYVEWYRQVLQLCEDLDDLPMAFDDSWERPDPTVTWRLAYQQGSTFPAPPAPPPALITAPGSATPPPKRDEHYVLDLCDEVLGPGERQATFDWLRGDASLATSARRKLPVDGFWPEHRIVVEYQERQHTESVPFWDTKVTATGMTRGEQRRLYDERKAAEIPRRGLTLVVIGYTDFPLKGKKIDRDRPRDLEIVRRALGEAREG